MLNEIKPEQVPKEAVEAARKIIRLPDEWIDDLIAAALNAWPGMRKPMKVYGLQSESWLELPLPQETRDDE